jgi:hypothetical protein
MDPRAKKMIIAVAVVILLAVVITAIVVPLRCHKDCLTNPNNDEYHKELALFKSLSPDKQIEYLNMSKDDKIAVYWRNAGNH